MDEDETLKRRLRKQKLTDKDEKYVQKLEDLKKHLPSLEKLLKSKSNYCVTKKKFKKVFFFIVVLF